MGVSANVQPSLAAAQTSAPAPVKAVRLSQNPLITKESSASLGDNINNPTVIRVPAWVERPLGRYYMYFSHHMGAHIRLAYADNITGPWTIHDPGVLNVRDSAFYRPQPDPPENLENFYTHVASPEVFIDQERRRIVMWFHGWWTNGTMWPIGEPEARAWAQQRGYGQHTQGAESRDGLRFESRPEITRASYLRVFPHDGALYAMARLGRLLRAPNTQTAFEAGPNPFRDGSNAERVRHVAVLKRGNHLYTFFTAIGDAPERIMVSTIELTGDWTTWKVSSASEILRPDAAYECPTLRIMPSVAGDVKEPVHQLRDPAVFEENGRTFLFYSFCGEQGIAGAELTFQ